MGDTKKKIKYPTKTGLNQEFNVKNSIQFECKAEFDQSICIVTSDSGCTIVYIGILVKRSCQYS